MVGIVPVYVCQGWKDNVGGEQIVGVREESRRSDDEDKPVKPRLVDSLNEILACFGGTLLSDVSVSLAIGGWDVSTYRAKPRPKRFRVFIRPEE